VPGEATAGRTSSVSSATVLYLLGSFYQLEVLYVRTFRVTINDKSYTVEIDDPNASPAIVRVNGKAFTVAIAEPTQNRRAAANVEADTDIDAAYVPVVTTTFVEAAPEPKVEASVATASPAGEGTEQVIAPMPGKILDIVVSVGAQVNQGDILCNLEAMKMKSPIRSTSAGAITQVLVTEGQNVDYGDVLFTLS